MHKGLNKKKKKTPPPPPLFVVRSICSELFGEAFDAPPRSFWWCCTNSSTKTLYKNGNQWQSDLIFVKVTCIPNESYVVEK